MLPVIADRKLLRKLSSAAIQSDFIYPNLKGIQGFQRPTLSLVRQFDIMTGPFIQIVNITITGYVLVAYIAPLVMFMSIIASQPQ